MITEKNLINLGFQRFDETPESSGSTHDWHYYTYSLGNGYEKFTLISNASDELPGDTWRVYFFNYDSIAIENMTDLVNLIEILKRGLK